MTASGRCMNIATALAASTCLASAFVAPNVFAPTAFSRVTPSSSYRQPLHMSSAGAAADEFEFDESNANKRVRVSPPSSSEPKSIAPPLAYEGVEYDFQDIAYYHSEERQQRLDAEKRALTRFAQGDELMDLRKDVESMRDDLQSAKSSGDQSKMDELKVKITEAGTRDAEFIYELARHRLKLCEREGLEEEAERFEAEAIAARSVLPQFNLEGLWVGKYGPHGYEMINVTYVEDQLIAYKVTGDHNVPKGEVTFSADLSPEAIEDADLDPIELGNDAAKQWGTRHLPRFPGQGQVAAEGFKHAQLVEGQLILVGEYFSFAWVELGHQIFFGRPSPELTLKMLKESQMKDLGSDEKESSDVAEMRAKAMRCLDETESLEWDADIAYQTSTGIFFEEGAFE